MPEPAIVATVPTAPRSRWSVDHWFYIAVALLMILLKVAAFGPSLVALSAVAAIVQVPVTVLLLSVSAIHDRLTERRVHPVSVWVPIVLFFWFGVWVSVVGPSPAWQGLTARLIR